MRTRTGQAALGAYRSLHQMVLKAASASAPALDTRSSKERESPPLIDRSILARNAHGSQEQTVNHRDFWNNSDFCSRAPNGRCFRICPWDPSISPWSLKKTSSVFSVSPISSSVAQRLPMQSSNAVQCA